MTDWRETILKQFAPQVARLTLVSDPDGLLLETAIWQEIERRGFEIHRFEDSLSFRYIYESRYRISWDQGEGPEVVLIVRGNEDTLERLPYDWLRIARRLHFSLAHIFPHLSYPIISELDRSMLDALYEAQEHQKPRTMGENATKEFVLRHVFEIDSTTIRHTADLLRALLKLHYRNQRLPATIQEHWIDLLKQGGNFPDWPWEQIIPDRESFLGFLQERWPVYLKSLEMEDELALRELAASYPFTYSGPGILPFGNEDIRIYIDNLFIERLLHPVQFRQGHKLTGSWVSVGIHSDQGAEEVERYQKLILKIGGSIPDEAANYPDWLEFARTWAELNYLRLAMMNRPKKATGKDHHEIEQQFTQLRSTVDKTFHDWIINQYSSLHNQPALPPVMLHHVPRAIARLINDQPGSKAALVVVDGLALDQWVILREVLDRQCPQLHIRSEAVFAWIPTSTPVSRQALFAGKPPLYFPSSIHTTNKEADLWSQFWSDMGLTPAQYAYGRGFGELDHLPKINELVSNSKLQVVGMVVDKVDKIMHGMQLGSAGMHNQVRQWGEQGFLSRLLMMLTELGFQVFLTSDHGNIEATGIGRLSEGAAADLRGERVRVYPTPELRKQFSQKVKDALEWEPVGLPMEYYPLLAPGRTAFIAEGERTVAHGGITIEEVIVPLINLQTRI